MTKEKTTTKVIYM